MGRGDDISIFPNAVAEKNMGRIYYLSPPSSFFFINMNSQPIQIREGGVKMGAVNATEDFNITPRAIKGNLF